MVVQDDEYVPPALPFRVWRDLWIGAVAGFGAALLIGFFMAAGSRGRDPDVVFRAMAQAGVIIDARIDRAPTAMRRGLMCASIAVHMEARGEPDAGQLAVAWVVRNRVEEMNSTACDQVFAPVQFSWTSYPIPKIAASVAASPDSWRLAQGAAWRAMVQGEPDPTNGANHFWSGRTPYWAKKVPRSKWLVIGGHTFIHIPRIRAPWVPLGSYRP